MCWSKNLTKIIISVYRKLTFMGQYTCWDSFGPKKRKTNLINTPSQSSWNLLSWKVLKWSQQNQKYLATKGKTKKLLFPEFKKKIQIFKHPKQFSLKKCPVYLKLPWIGNVSLKYEKHTKSAVYNSFGSMSARIVFSSKKCRLLFKRIFCLLISKVILYINTHATVVVCA